MNPSNAVSVDDLKFLLKHSAYISTIRGYILCSTVIVIGKHLGLEWFFRIQSLVNNVRLQLGYRSCFDCNSDSHRNPKKVIGAEYELIIISKTGDIVITKESSCFIGKEIFVKKDVLDNLVNDILVIEYRINVKEYMGCRLEKLRGLNEESPISVGNIVKLNIGGKVFQTKKSTLTNYVGMLKAMLEWNPLFHIIETDENGCIFIDRSPKHFDMILNYMRDGDAALPECRSEVYAILKEAQHYRLDGLLRICNEHLKENGNY